MLSLICESSLLLFYFQGNEEMWEFEFESEEKRKRVKAKESAHNLFSAHLTAESCKRFELINIGPSSSKVSYMIHLACFFMNIVLFLQIGSYMILNYY